MHKVTWFCLAVLIATYLTAPIQDPDLWWHIAIGKWILSHGAIPQQDYWNMFGIGQPWRAYSWSNEILFALVDSHFGVHGLLVLKLVVAFGIVASICYALGRIAGDHFLGVLLGLAASAGCYNHLTLRPQSIVWIAFVWLLFVSERIRVEGNTKGRLIALAALMAGWANSHLSAVLGLAGIFLWLFDDWRSPRKAFIATGAGFIGTLFTPYLGGEWITFIKKTGHPVQYSLISEFHPATILQYSTGFLVIGSVLFLYILHRRPRSASVVTLCGWGGFFFGALAVLKFIPFATILSFALAARVWRDAAAEPQILGPLSEAPKKLYDLLQHVPKEGLSFLMLCLAVVNVFGLWRNPLQREVVPQAALDFFEAHHLPHPVLNSFGLGGYLIYRFSDAGGNPKHLVAIDGRTNVNPPEIWEKSVSAWLGKTGWYDFVDKVQAQTIIWSTGSPFIRLLVATNEWCIVYQDKVAIPDQGSSVLVRRSYFNERKGELTSPNCSL